MFVNGLLLCIIHWHDGETEMARARELVGLSVITSDASQLGKVDGTEVDTESWKVTHLRIDLTDDSIRALGLKKPFMGGIRICLPVDQVSRMGDVATLKITLAEVKNTPECSTK
jgi:sporulation protein YlmC with PRC-barrel domain